ncbi:hypothetical protein pb186bvf_020970, partial [Paramecium bursaria]
MGLWKILLTLYATIYVNPGDSNFKHEVSQSQLSDGMVSTGF